jgi:hypothetical protein
MNGELQQQPIRTISVIDPISQAIDRTRDVLFRPFQIETWLILGFCAWLAQLGQGGGGPNVQSSSDDSHQLRHDFHHAWAWVIDHLIPILVIGILVLAVIVVIWLSFLWLSSRGKFMFLDGVVRHRGAVVEPWHRFREHANSLFVFRLLVGLVSGVFMLGFVLLLLTFVWLWAEMRLAEPIFILGTITTILGIVGIALVLGLVALAIEDFVVPLMYVRNCAIGVAWSELSSLIGARPGAFLLYMLIRLFASFVICLIGIAICCLTCCLVLLPYVGVVITLPLWVFKRCYPLYFLAQFGPEYSRLAMATPGSAAGSVG